MFNYSENLHHIFMSLSNVRILKIVFHPCKIKIWTLTKQFLKKRELLQLKTKKIYTLLGEYIRRFMDREVGNYVMEDMKRRQGFFV